MEGWQAGPVILTGPAKMIGRAFYSTTASTDEIFL